MLSPMLFTAKFASLLRCCWSRCRQLVTGFGGCCVLGDYSLSSMTDIGEIGYYAINSGSVSLSSSDLIASCGNLALLPICISCDSSSTTRSLVCSPGGFYRPDDYCSSSLSLTSSPIFLQMSFTRLSSWSRGLRHASLND